MPTIQVRVDEKLRKDADALFKRYGMTTAMAVKIFLHLAIEKQTLPFDIVTQKKENEH